MFARVPAAAVVASLAFPTGGAAQTPYGYETGTSQYRVTQNTKTVQEMMGQKQEIPSTTFQLFTMAVTRPSKDTIVASYSIDSIYVSTPMGTAAPGLDRLKGLKVEVKVSPTGEVYSATGPTDEQVPNASIYTDAFKGFVPRTRPNLARGVTWSDTLSGKINQFGLDLDRKVISRSDVLKDTTIAGTNAWIIQRRDSTFLAGSGTGQSGPMIMEGTMVSLSHMFMTPKGSLVGGRSSDESSMRVILSANGMEIVIKTSSETKIEKAK